MVKYLQSRMILLETSHWFVYVSSIIPERYYEKVIRSLKKQQPQNWKLTKNQDVKNNDRTVQWNIPVP